jgi:hypothetical protein
MGTTYGRPHTIDDNRVLHSKLPSQPETENESPELCLGTFPLYGVAAILTSELPSREAPFSMRSCAF